MQHVEMCTPTSPRKEWVNQIPSIRSTVWRKDDFCNTLRDWVHRTGGSLQSFSLRCWVLPRDNHLLTEEMKRAPRNATWVAKPPSRGEGRGIFLGTRSRLACSWSLFTDLHTVKAFDDIQRHWENAKRHTASSLVVQPLLEPPVTINGFKFDLRCYVLVTSMSPLRLYVYGEGIVRFASLKVLRVLSKKSTSCSLATV